MVFLDSTAKSTAVIEWKSEESKRNKPQWTKNKEPQLFGITTLSNYFRVFSGCFNTQENAEKRT